MNQFLANLIWLLHIAFILFYVITPFTDIHKYTEMHILMLATGPLLWIHWLCNSDECALTHLENFFRGGVEKKDSFFFNLVQPIYQPTNDQQIRQFIWVASISLWLITLAKFIKNPCVFKNFFRRAIHGPLVDQSISDGARPSVVGVITTSSGVSENGQTLTRKRVVTRYISQPERFASII